MSFTYTNNTTKNASSIPTSGKNPEVIIGNSITVPTPSPISRKVFTRRNYSPLAKFTHVKKDPSSSDFFLSGSTDTIKAEDSIFFYRMDSQIESFAAMPSFMTKEDYEDGFSMTPTGFLTPQNSVMPKLLVPSQNIIDNGLYGSKIFEGKLGWLTLGITIGEDADTWTTSQDGQKMIVLNKLNKNDKVNFRHAVLDPKNIFINQYSDMDSNKIVGNGAFQVVVCFMESDMVSQELQKEGSFYPTDNTKGSIVDDKTQPRITFTMGDLFVAIKNDGSCSAEWLSGEKNSEMLNLISGAGSETIPQAKFAEEAGGKVYTLSICPCWNGVVLQSGVQNAKNIVGPSAVYLKKYASATIWDFCRQYPINNGEQRVAFNPKEPNEILVGVTSAKDNMYAVPDLGNDTTIFEVRTYYCSCKVAFAPIYFHNNVVFDHVIRGNAETTDYSYNYKMYPIWTKNNTDCRILNLDQGGLSFADTGKEGELEFTKYLYAHLAVQPGNEEIYQRKAFEIFGCILEMEEIKKVNTPSYPSPYNNGISNWEDYITSVSLSQSLDSNNGSITFDKFGATRDQDSALVQNVGVVNVSVKGGYNTNGATNGDSSTSLLFKGYSWSASENKSPNGNEVTVSLIGIEKRLEDVVLVNPPIFDGYSFSEVVQYLCEQAGVAYEFSGSSEPSTPLLMSTDINVAIYNWPTGMDVRSALNQICIDTAHRYTPINGVLVFYGLNDDGSPNYSGTTWTGFDGTNIQTYDTSPDFDGIRNIIIVMSMRKFVNAQGSKFDEDFPTYPMTTMRKSDTDPNIPWFKGLCYTIPGFVEQEGLDRIGDNIEKSTKKYELLGSTTIPGANIKVLDTFLGMMVTEVTHNIDLVNKTWTTTLGFMRIGS